MNSPSLRALRRHLLRDVTSLFLFTGIMLQSATAVAPGWWNTQHVLTPGAIADDYTVANLGQLKNVAKKAAVEFNSALANGAGNDINDLMAAWEAPPAAGVARDDYAALTIGQLKSVARLFYDRLAEAGVTEIGSYPWSGKDADDYALANLGQLKSVFNFETATGDVNQNGMPDVWEMRHFGNLNQNPGNDFDNDGLSNLAEYQATTNPANTDTDADGVSDGQEVAQGTDPTQLPPSATWTQAQLAAAAAAYEIGLQQRNRHAYSDVWEYGGLPDGDPETEDEVYYDYWTYMDDDYEHEIWTGSSSTNWPDKAEELAEGAQAAYDSVDAAEMNGWEAISPAGEDGVATLSPSGWVEAFALVERGVGTAKAEYRLVRRLKAGATAPVDSAGNLIMPEIKRSFVKVTSIASGNSAPTTTTEVVEFTIEVGQEISTTTTGVLFPPAATAGGHRIELVPVEFITRQSKESETTVAVQGIGLTNQRPTVKLDSVSASNVSISNGMATVQIKGSVRDAIADNVPDGKGADVESVRILVNGEEQDTASVNRQQDGTATDWRQFPCKGVIQPTSVSFAAQSLVTVRVETAPNAAGEVGYDEVQFRFDRQASSGTLVGGGTISYDLHLAGAPQPGSIDTLQAKASAEQSYTTLTETAADTNVFASPDGQFVVRLFSTSALTNQADEISCIVWDAASAHSASGSGGGSAFCLETGAATNTFQYTQTIQPIRTGVTYSYTLAEVINAETPDAGGNHPFTWRISGFGDAAQIKTKLGGATFDTHSYGGSLMPKGSETRYVISYLVRDAEEENPPLKMLYYDEISQSVVTKTISNPAELLKLKLVTNQQETETIKLAQGQMEWRTPAGELVEDLQKLPVQTLVDYINGDNDIEIDDDSSQVLRVTAINKDAPRVKVRSSEIHTDFFELSKSNGSGSKQAKLKEIGSGTFESEQKIIVYESSPGIQTLSESQWQALKAKGYLAVHNLSAEALQIINDIGLDDLAEEVKQDHHIFNQWDGPNVDPRYKNFWSKVFDPGTFDVHDFTVEVARKRHARFSRGCTDAWKSFINSVTDAQGNILPHLTKEYVRGETVEMAIDLAEYYDVPLEKVRRYPPKAAGSAKPALGSKLDDLIKLDSTHHSIRWADPTDHRTLRWKKYTSKAVSRFGKNFVRSMPFLGHAMTAWAVVAFASNPSGAIASELNISPEAAQLLLEGKVSVRLQLWQPNSPVQTAQMANGGSVHIGMAHYYAHMQFSDLYDTWYVTRVEEGEVVGIETTARTGVVNLRVRVGQEERLHPNVNDIRPGIPEEGKPAPPGW